MKLRDITTPDLLSERRPLQDLASNTNSRTRATMLYRLIEEIDSELSRREGDTVSGMPDTTSDSGDVELNDTDFDEENKKAMIEFKYNVESSEFITSWTKEVLEYYKPSEIAALDDILKYAIEAMIEYIDGK